MITLVMSPSITFSWLIILRMCCTCGSGGGGGNDYVAVAGNDDDEGDGNWFIICFSTDSDQRYGGEMAHSTHEELTVDKQRTCGTIKETSNISEVDKSHEVTDILSTSCMGNQLSVSDNTSGEISDPCFV
jgi:hypothetical protein